MRLIWEVQYILAKTRPSKIDFKDLKLSFERTYADGSGTESTRLTPEDEKARREEATKIAKARWGVLLAGSAAVIETNAEDSTTKTIRPGEKILQRRKQMMKEPRRGN